VQVRGAFSTQLVADIDRQLDSGAPAVDVAILQTPQDFARWKAAGALLQTDFPAMEHLAPVMAGWLRSGPAPANSSSSRQALLQPVRPQVSLHVRLSGTDHECRGGTEADLGRSPPVLF
jgi:hypothetical protein